MIYKYIIFHVSNTVKKKSVNTFFSGDFFFPVKKIIKRNFFFFHFWPNEFSFFSFFFRRRIFCVEKKKISLFQFIFFSVCWISISSVSAASSSHSLSRRPNKNTGGRRKCVFLEQKLVLFSTLFRSDTSLCLQQSHFRIIYWGVVLVNSVPNTQKISGI